MRFREFLQLELFDNLGAAADVKWAPHEPVRGRTTPYKAVFSDGGQEYYVTFKPRMWQYKQVGITYYTISFNVANMPDADKKNQGAYPMTNRMRPFSVVGKVASIVGEFIDYADPDAITWSAVDQKLNRMYDLLSKKYLSGRFQPHQFGKDTIFIKTEIATTGVKRPVV